MLLLDPKEPGAAAAAAALARLFEDARAAAGPAQAAAIVELEALQAMLKARADGTIAGLHHGGGQGEEAAAPDEGYPQGAPGDPTTGP